MSTGTTNNCTTPLSWLVLERHQLGELPPAEEAAVDSHLRQCADCTALLARIAEDDAGALPALPTPLERRGPFQMARIGRARTAAIVTTVAVAAALLLAVGRKPRVVVDGAPSARVKGADISFALVREDEAMLAEAGGTYHDGERFKAVVTCPPGLRASFDVAVFEHDAVTFPLAPSAELACGNAVALPGAFRVTGHDRMTVCLVWQPNGVVDRETLRRMTPDMLSGAQCKTLEPLP
jgi:Putative zinc-finger